MLDDVADSVRRLRLLTGLDPDYAAARHRVDTGQWHRICRGVVLMAATPEWLDRAVGLALGLDGTLCFATAARIWGLEIPTWAEHIELASPSRAARKATTPGVRMHQMDIPDEDVQELHGLRITSVVRTVVDCARTFPPTAAVVVIESAVRHGLATLGEIAEAIGRLRRVRGAVRARKALERVDLRSESGLETEARLLLTDAGLPPSTLQLRLVRNGAEIRLDLAYEAHLVGVEIDGMAAHSGRVRFQSDRRRSNAIVASGDGWRILHFTAHDIRRDPGYVVATVRAALAAQAA